MSRWEGRSEAKIEDESKVKMASFAKATPKGCASWLARQGGKKENAEKLKTLP